jgi:hypothetical protein
VTVEGTSLGVQAGDGDLNLVGAVALDHYGRPGLILRREREPACGGCLIYKGVLVAPFGDPWGNGHWRWTAARPLVIATSVREYAEATDDLLGLVELRRRRAASVVG